MATRRRKGTGSIRHLDGDRYQVTVKQGDRRVSRVFHAPNPTAAEVAADQVRLELRAELANPRTAERAERQAWTVSKYADYYLEQWAKEHLATTTYRRYEQALRDHVKPRIGKMKMAEVTETDLQRLYTSLASKGARKRGGDTALSGPSIWTIHNIIRAMFTFAVDVQHDLPRNPAAGKSARPKNVARTAAPKRAVDVSEVERFVALCTADDPRIAVPVMLSAWLGTRRSETLALRWSDVDYGAGRVSIQRSVTQTPEDGIVVKERTKNGKTRLVPLDAHTISELRRIQTDQRERRMRLGKAWKGAAKPAEDWICADADGALIAPATFEGAFRNSAERIKMPNVTPHLLRHAFVSQMIALGYDAVTISDITGHSPDVLLRVYAHAYQERAREAVDTLGKAREAARAAL